MAEFYGYKTNTHTRACKINIGESAKLTDESFKSKPELFEN